MEASHGAHEHVGANEASKLVRVTAVLIAVVSALAAFVSHEAIDHGTKALLYKSEAAQKKTEASNQWAYYQAVSTKAHIMELGQRLLPPSLAAKEREKLAKYEKQKGEIQARAEEMEKATRIADEAARGLLRPRERFMSSLILLEVAIALGSISILTRSRVFFGLALLGGVAGSAYAVLALVTK